jgi:AcrR family transcriptional regulator
LVTKSRPSKADKILDAAVSLFAAKPFHEVRLDDIAALAEVGKGTIYLYWASKEEVYLAIVRRGFATVLERLERDLPACQGRCLEELRVVVGALLDFAFAFPGVYRIMRSGGMTPEDADLQCIRREVTERISEVIRRGVESGDLVDPCPALTAQYILSSVRGAFLYPPPGMTREMLSNHLMHVLRRGIGAEVRAQ